MAKKKKMGTVRNRKPEKVNVFPIYFIVAFEFVFYFAYVNLFEFIFLKVHAPEYFVSSKYNVFLFLFFLFALITIASTIVSLFLKKEIKKRFIICSTAVSAVVLAVMIILNCNVWSFNKDAFSYNTILQKDKIVYLYDDIDFVEVEEIRYFMLSKSYHIDYTFYMKDGRRFKIDAFEIFCEADAKLIEFDKAISNKRKIVGNYYYNGNTSQELNDYYISLFDSKQR